MGRGGRDHARSHPSDTGDLIGRFRRASRAQAADVFPAWSRATPKVRHNASRRIGDGILARRDELDRLLSREEGKTLAEGIGETALVMHDTRRPGCRRGTGPTAGTSRVSLPT